MTIYVDALRSWDSNPDNAQARRYFGNGKRSCHMTSDTSVDELIAFARKIGLSPFWIQQEPRDPLWLIHFDLTPSKRALAVKAGAVEFDMLEEAYPLMHDERCPCSVDGCTNMAIRLCALSDMPICYKHSAFYGNLDGRKAYVVHYNGKMVAVITNLADE